MTSKIKVDNINKVSDDSNIINKCGTTVTVGAASDGVRTGSNNLQASDGGNLISQSGTTITIGASGDTISLACGASQSGFGRSGTVDWQTGSVKTGTFTGESGKGYFVNTTSGAVTGNLPASPSAGDIVAFADYAGTAGSNNITIGRNGSNIEGGTTDGTISTNRETKTLVYVDGTQGWVPVNDNFDSIITPAYIAATGGTVTTVCTNFKVHTFTGPGTFTVCSVGNAAGSNTVSYMVVAGGGGGGATENAGNNRGGGAGAGGYRESKAASDSYTASPLNATSGPGYNLPVSAQGYPITVGGGGPGAYGSGASNGANSIFSTITSAGGGKGGECSPNPTAASGTGGSGGGASARGSGAAGNTPPVSPPQGQNGSDSTGFNGTGGGGGGAGAAGGTGFGGTGVASSINGTPTTRAGGGGAPGSGPGAGGSGGGGTANGGAATANTGGGGAANYGSSAAGGSGGSGIVIIRYKFQ
jgi:hypothetical protein